jgi:hypothetical protein
VFFALEKIQPTDFTAAAVKSLKGQQYYRYQSQMGLVW